MRGVRQEGRCRARWTIELSAYSSVVPPRCYVQIVLRDTLKRSDEGMREKEVQRRKQEEGRRKGKERPEYSLNGWTGKWR